MLIRNESCAIIILDSPFFANYLREYIAGVKDIVLLIKKDPTFLESVFKHAGWTPSGAQFCSGNETEICSWEEIIS